MASAFHVDTNPKIQTLLETIAQMLGKDINLSNSKSFRAVIESPDGQNINLRVLPLEQGLPTTQLGKSGEALVVPGGGAADLDGAYGTAELADGFVDVTVPGGVPENAIVFATITTPEGVPKVLDAVRATDEIITIDSLGGQSYATLPEDSGVDATLVAGEDDAIALDNVVDDVLAVVETATGGDPADHFSVVRVNNTTVKVQAHDANGDFVNTNESEVRVYNFGQSAQDTSTVRWAVIRP